MLWYLEFPVRYDLAELSRCSFVLNMFIDIQTSKELIQMDINKKMRNGIFTMNGEHTQSEN